ncbi:uncharacterized protein LOC119730263 [Patiria miniata]|uniref:THAP-type domain-containing protein n=1 Tax=Patiria miniata TaxID=46514 RepID=A0A914A6F8_PATMI|nr:uncharacterized protein LOC119730263 [Patiria miniata]
MAYREKKTTQRSARARKHCSMVGCSHNRENCPSDGFFCFPKKSEKRLQLWITLSGRSDKRRNDGSLWKPNRYSRLCACHFEDGKKHNEPTLKTAADYSELIAEHKRDASAPCPLASADHNYSRSCQQIKKAAAKTHVHLGTQVTFPEEDSCTCVGAHAQVYVHTMFCCRDGVDVGIQTSFHRDPCSDHTETRDQCVGPDARPGKPECTGFRGWDGTEGAKDSLQDMTGVPPSVFDLLLSLLPPRSKGMCLENCLILFLMKLRFGLPFSLLAVMFSVSRTTASRTFQVVLESLSKATHDWILWPSSATIRSMLPSCFSAYPNARCIIDCFEFKTERPPTVKSQFLMYSSDKGTYTCKVLVGISPHGLISFLSQTYSGRTTDSQVIIQSGFLDVLEPGDVIVADEGFPEIQTEIAGKQAIVVMPPFAVPHKDLKSAYSISSVRVHVERVIQRLRSYSILNGTFPNELLPHVNNIVHMCAVLANLQSPVTKD